MNDEECIKLLRLLLKYFEEYTESDTSMTVANLAEDLAMSMDITTDEADHIRVRLEELR